MYTTNSSKQVVKHASRRMTLSLIQRLYALRLIHNHAADQRCADADILASASALVCELGEGHGC